MFVFVLFVFTPIKVPTSENIKLAKYITTIVGWNRTVCTYWDDANENYIDIFTCDDPIDSEAKFYGTIGLSDYPNEMPISAIPAQSFR